MRLIDADALMMSLADWWYSSFGEKETEDAKAIHEVMDKIEECLPIFEVNVSPAQPEITNEAAVGYLQSTGWMQQHDREIYEMGLKERLTDDSDSYSALLEPYKGGSK